MGKERLADPGFYIEYYGKEKYNFVKGSEQPDETFGVTYISPDGTCQYIHWMAVGMSEDWQTLLWTCAPTKKKVEKAKTAKPDKELERFIYFRTHEELCQFPFIDHKPKARTLPRNFKA